MEKLSEDLRYPIGKFSPKPFSENQKQEWLNDIKFLPGLIENSILNLDEKQLHTPYRPGGWTVHQLIHHVADSHINAYCRFRLALTEENPVIKPYNEKLWAELNDTKNLPVNISITLLHALHARWYECIRSLTQEQFMRTIHHPDDKKDKTLWDLLGTYSWHGLHHVAHITSLRERMSW